MPKRGRTEDDVDKKLEKEEEDDDEEGVVDEHDDEEEDEEEFDEDDDDDEDEDESLPSQSFVAWLEEGATQLSQLSVGECHFSNVEHTGSPDAPNTYCVVYEMTMTAALPAAQQEDEEEDEEAPLLYSFTNGFPFRILPASACVGIPLEPVAPPMTADAVTDAVTATATADDDDDDDDDIVYTTYSMNADIHQSLLEELNNNNTSSSSSPSDSPTYTKISPKWRLPTLATAEEAVDGITAWWKAGQNKTGWDLQKIPQTDYTTVKTMESGDGDATTTTTNNNILLQLYKDLCAFKPLTPNDSRDAIEERFEWRTCLCTYFAWAVPNEEALQLLENLGKPILEIGAGTGYWAWLLHERGVVDIVAYDMKESHGGHKHRFRHGLVQDGGVEQASKCGNDGDEEQQEHAGRALFLCWPDIVGDSASDDADRGTFGVDTLKAYNGDTVIYVGELGPNVVRAAKGWGDPFPPGGSTASAAFQTELQSSWRLKGEKIQLPNWPPYNSHLTVWVRK